MAFPTSSHYQIGLRLGIAVIRTFDFGRDSQRPHAALAISIEFATPTTTR